MAGNLVYKTGSATNATDLYGQLTSLLTATFSTSEPRGLGWTEGYSLGATGGVFDSYGSSGDERIFVKLEVNGNNIDRTICQAYSKLDGYMTNSVGGDGYAQITVGASTVQYWLVGNQDFFHITVLSGADYYHNYIGLLNRIGPNENSSLYGVIPPTPTTTTTPTVTFTIGTATTLYLRLGEDGYGGLSVNDNHTLVAGSYLYIVDQTTGTSTSGNIGLVHVTAVSQANNYVTMDYISGSNTFSSFSIIGLDPQPMAINSSGTVVGTGTFKLLSDQAYNLGASYNALNETIYGVSNALQNPTYRRLYVGYPIRILNATDFRGSLKGLVSAPAAYIAAQDMFQTYDGKYRFINMPDGSIFIGIGSIR